MIVIPNDKKNIEKTNIIIFRSSRIHELTHPQHDPPPAYFRGQFHPVERTPPAAASDAGKPVNFLSLSRPQGSIKGAYFIDPRIRISQSLLPPLAADETEATRRNAYLHTSHGSIKVDLSLIGDGKAKGKVDIFLRSERKGIKARLHASDGTRPSLRLKVQSRNSIALQIPRSFRGPVIVRTRKGTVRVSDALAAHFTTFSEVNHTHRCFIGDFSDWIVDSEAWTGDEIEVESTHGKLKLQDEPEMKSKHKAKAAGHSSCARASASGSVSTSSISSDSCGSHHKRRSTKRGVDVSFEKGQFVGEKIAV
ncbi:hypothetical protein C8R47DRAFT_1063145 [Mycena vitilis]|nr:hypothetical protein C8R47DRAFT_1063145 [Mycena vitilis]